MTEDTIPYATPVRAGINARDLFGVVVRAVGLGLVIWGIYCLVYLANVLLLAAPREDFTTGTFVIVSLFFIGAGVSLLRGEWVVRFAYGERHHE